MSAETQHEAWAVISAPGKTSDSAHSQKLPDPRPQLPRNLEEDSRKRGLVLAAAAHELRTPTTVIAGYLELLLTEKVGLLSDRQRQILQDTQANCSRLQRIIRDFLTYTSLERGKLTMKFERAQLNVCLSELYGIWLPRYQKNGVALSFFPSSNLEPLEFDYYKVQHIVSNLLDNALKFTPAGGSVWLSSQPYWWERRYREDRPADEGRRRQTSGQPNAARVTVADTGSGIAPEYHQEIFEEFSDVPGQEPAKSSSGLGLAIARRMVLAHDGKIWVESDSGSGSKFCFLLPLTQHQECVQGAQTE